MSAKENLRMPVLITGNMGYVGPVVTRFLRDNFNDEELIGFDAGSFGHSLTGADILRERLCSTGRCSGTSG
jgi:hypothetical protein